MIKIKRYNRRNPQEEIMKQPIVISHERSGTHFLMNTLALNFGYIARPWIDLDFCQKINLHSSKAVGNFFKQINEKMIFNIIKSHHPFEFFSDFIDYMVEHFHIFYIYRDPRDVMLSFWELIQKLPWDEGPKTLSVSDFARSEPRGAMLRYQKEQMKTVLHRWKKHIEGWTNFAQQNDNKIILVKYEDLNLNFDKTVKQLGQKIVHPVEKPIKPSAYENVIMVGKAQVGRHRIYLIPEDYSFFNGIVGKTMTRLGYV